MLAAAVALLVIAAPLVRDVNGGVLAPRPRARIVSIAPALTEILYEIGAGSMLVGGSDYCDYPPAAKKLPKVGALTNLDVEKVVALRPSLIVTTSGSRDQWKALQRITRAPVFVGADGGLDRLQENVRALGHVTGHVTEAAALGSRIKASLAGLTERMKAKTRPRVFFMVWNDPLMTAGPGSYLDELITAAGGENLGRTGKGLYPTMTWEALLVNPPDVVISTNNLQKAVRDASKRLKPKRAVVLDEDILSRQGPRVVEALELLYRAIHPEDKTSL